MTAIPKIKLESVERFERDYTLRLPFRFGVITVTEGTQAVIRAKIALEDGRTAVGVAAEALGAKWFDKSPAFSDAQNLDQLRQALGLAIELYRARGWSTPFGLYADTYRDQLARGADLGLVPLVASYGPALLDRAILDALGRATELSFADMIRRNLRGHRDDRPDARSGRLRPAAVPGQPAPGSRHRRAPHRRPRRSHRRRRSGASGPRQRRTCPRRWRRSCATTGAGTTSSRSPATSRRTSRGSPASPPCSTATPATTGQRSTATSNTTRSTASPSCGAACARRRRSSAWSPPRSSSSSRSSAPRPCRSRSMRWPS